MAQLKLKLKYNPTFDFSLADFYDSSEDEMEFTSWGKMEPEWSNVMGDFKDSGSSDVELASRALSLALISVTQFKVKYPLNGVEDIKAMRDSIEGQHKGAGDRFITNLAVAQHAIYWKRIAEKIKNSEAPLPPSTNGASPDKAGQKTAKVKTAN